MMNHQQRHREKHKLIQDQLQVADDCVFLWQVGIRADEDLFKPYIESRIERFKRLLMEDAAKGPTAR